MSRLRACDGCTVCCEFLAIEELDLEAGVPCPHQCAAGCAIYADRPQTCRGFACGWAAGMVPGPERPDLAGILIWMHGDDLHLRELRLGALNASWRQRLALWSVAFSCYVERADGVREVLGPTGP